METHTKMEINELSKESSEELESIGRVNKKYFREEGLKLLLYGIASLIGDILLTYLWVKFPSIFSNFFVSLAIMALIVIILIAGIVMIVKGIKSLLLPVPKAPEKIEKLIDNYYSTFFWEVNNCLGIRLGKSVSWFKSYVCLLKKERDSIGNYQQYVKQRIETASTLAKELKTSWPFLSEIQLINTETDLLSNSNNLQIISLKFILKMFSGERLSTVDPLTHIGNLEIAESIIISTFNNRLYIYDAEWHGKTTLLLQGETDKPEVYL